MTDAERMRHCFRTAFGGTEGRTMLAWLATECGVFETESDKVDKSLTALWGRLMHLAGAARPSLYGDVMQGIVDMSGMPDREGDAYGDDDIV